VIEIKGYLSYNVIIILLLLLVPIQNSS